MAIRLVEDGERIEVKIGAAVFGLRRLPYSEVDALRGKYLFGNPGPMDRPGFVSAVIETALMDWDGVDDKNGPVPITKENRERLSRLLPAAVMDRLSAAILADGVEVDTVLGNSAKSSAGS